MARFRWRVTTTGPASSGSEARAATATAVCGSISSPVASRVARMAWRVSSSLTATPRNTWRMAASAWGGMSRTPASAKAWKARSVSSASRCTLSK